MVLTVSVLVLVFYVIVKVETFQISPNTLLYCKSSKLSSGRRELFFDIVRSGLSDRFDESKLDRMNDFMRYSSGSTALPDNCNAHMQEVIPGLS